MRESKNPEESIRFASPLNVRVPSLPPQLEKKRDFQTKKKKNSFFLFLFFWSLFFFSGGARTQKFLQSEKEKSLNGERKKEERRGVPLLLSLMAVGAGSNKKQKHGRGETEEAG